MKSSGKVLTNFIWRFAERCGAQLVSFIVSIVLARLLAPEVYGTVALVTVFTNILQVFVDSGMGNALIQKKNADDVDFSTVFYFNVVVCVLLYGGMFVAAPFIAGFYEDNSLIAVIRVLSLILVIAGVKNIQQAYVSRNLLFKRFFFATLGGTIVSAVLGIALAYAGFGVWALVAQQLSNKAIDTIILWITVKWHPKRVFSIQRLKGLFSYGWKLLVSGLLDTVYNNARSLIIGKMYSERNLAFYNQGDKFPNVIVSNVNTSIDSVLFPVMSSEQDNAEHVKNMTRRAIMISTYVMAPLMMGICFTAPVLVELVLTEKWLPCVPFMRIFCITYMFYPIHTANLNAIKAMGRSDLFLKLEIIKKIVGISLLFFSMWFGVMAMAYSMLIGSVLCQIINTYPNKRLLEYSYLHQLKDILPGISMAVIMGFCVLFVPRLGCSLGVTLVIQVGIGVAVYVLGSILFRINSFQYLQEMLKPVLGKYVGKIKRKIKEI